MSCPAREWPLPDIRDRAAAPVEPGLPGCFRKAGLPGAVAQYSTRVRSVPGIAASSSRKAAPWASSAATSITT